MIDSPSTLADLNALPSGHRCPHCGTNIPHDAPRCPGCPPAGSPPPSSSSSVHPPETESQPEHTPPQGALPTRLPPPEDTSFSDEAWNASITEREQTDTADLIDQPDSLSTDFRHSGWKHNRLLVYRSLRRTEQCPNRQRSFSECGSQSYVLQSIEHPQVYKVAGSSCHDRFCLPCASDRARCIAMNVLDFIEDRKLRFLTLTLKASADPLSEQLDKLYSSFQALRRRRFWTKHVTGGMAFLELTFNAKADTWHPHFHIIIEGTYLDHSQLRKLWYYITGDSFVVDIRPVPDNRTTGRYVTKYASKPFNNTFLNRDYALDEAVVALKGRKLLFTFGKWRGLTTITTPDDSSWQYIAPLDNVIANAARGDSDALKILHGLTDADILPILARVSALPPPAPQPPPVLKQLTFFGAWNDHGDYL